MVWGRKDKQEDQPKEVEYKPSLQVVDVRNVDPDKPAGLEGSVGKTVDIKDGSEYNRPALTPYYFKIEEPSRTGLKQIIDSPDNFPNVKIRLLTAPKAEAFGKSLKLNGTELSIISEYDSGWKEDPAIQARADYANLPGRVGRYYPKLLGAVIKERE